MTVSELIEELKKMPGHYPVYMTVPSAFEDEGGGGPNEDWHSLHGVSMQSGMGNVGIVIRLEAP